MRLGTAMFAPHLAVLQCSTCIVNPEKCAPRDAARHRGTARGAVIAQRAGPPCSFKPYL